MQIRIKITKWVAVESRLFHLMRGMGKEVGCRKRTGNFLAILIKQIRFVKTWQIITKHIQ